MNRLTKKWCSPDGETGGTPAPEPIQETPTQQENIAPELKQMTQEEIDKMVDRAFAKGAKAAKKEVQENSSSNETDLNAQKEVEAKLQAANARLLQAEIKTQALDLGLTANGVKVASSMPYFNDCIDDDGNICVDEVQEVLEKFAKDFPELVTKPVPHNYAENTGSSQIPTAPKTTRRKLNQNRII